MGLFVFQFQYLELVSPFLYILTLSSSNSMAFVVCFVIWSGTALSTHVLVVLSGTKILWLEIIFSKITVIKSKRF